MIRSFVFLTSLCFLACTGFAQDAAPVVARHGAVAAMLALPVKYNNGILKVSSAEEGNPNPSQWYIIARDTDTQGTIRSITVAGGQVIADSPSLNVGEMFRESAYISAVGLTFDSGDVFLKALSYATANNKSLGGVSYTLIKKGPDVAPIWDLKCYDPSNHYLGDLQVVATSGEVISHKGFSKTP